MPVTNQWSMSPPVPHVRLSCAGHPCLYSGGWPQRWTLCHSHTLPTYCLIKQCFISRGSFAFQFTCEWAVISLMSHVSLLSKCNSIHYSPPSPVSRASTEFQWEKGWTCLDFRYSLMATKPMTVLFCITRGQPKWQSASSRQPQGEGAMGFMNLLCSALPCAWICWWQKSSQLFRHHDYKLSLYSSAVRLKVC